VTPDVELVTLVLANFIDNAIKYSSWEFAVRLVLGKQAEVASRLRHKLRDKATSC